MAVFNRESTGPKIKSVRKGAEKRAYDAYNEHKISPPQSNQSQSSYQLPSSQTPDPLDSNTNHYQKGIQHNVVDKFNRTKEIFSGIPSAISNKDGYTPELQDHLTKTANSFSSSVRSGFIMPAKQIQHDVEQGMTGGMAQAHEYRMMKNVSSLGASLVVDAVMQANNSKVINRINSEKGLPGDINEIITIQGLKDTHNVLHQSGITKNANFKLRSEKDLRNLTNLMDVYSIKQGHGKLSTMSSASLLNLKNRLLDKNDTASQEIHQLIDQRLKINKTVSLKGHALGRNTRNIKSRLKRVALSTISESDFYRGYTTLMQTKASVNAVTKAVMLQGKMTYKGMRIIAKGSSKSSQFALRKIGSTNSIKIADGIQRVTSGIGGFADFGEKSLTEVVRIPAKLRVKMDLTKTIASDRLKHAPQMIRRSKVYKNANRRLRTTRVGKKVRSVKWRTRKLTKTLGKTKVGAVVKTAKKFTGKSLTAPLKLMGSFTRGISAALTAVKALLLKALLILVGGVLFAAAIVSVASGVVTTLTIIGDAVSNNLEDFKTKTTMGATYEKLLKKEEEFNSAIMNLNTTLLIPNEYAQYGIKKFSNINVHYLGADGKEISWSGAIGNMDITPTEVTNEVWSYLKKKGWTNMAIAGLLGNMQRESGFRVAALEHGSDDGSATMLNSGFGLCQWTNTGGNAHGRRYGLFQYARTHGGSPSDIDMQLGYLLYGEGSDSTLARKYGKMEFASAAAATEYFCNKWERPKASTSALASVRIPAAQKFYEYYTKNSDYANIIADGSGEEDISGDAEIIASSYSTSNTTTIKGILSMAATYIEQDFNKYGAFSDGIFADSIYKDYAAKLYDSSHIIGIDKTPPTVYYDPALSANEPEPEYHVATANCDNKIPGGSSEEDWLNSGTGINRRFSLSLKKERDSYDHETTKSNGDSETETIYYDKYEILETGPYGSVVFDSDRSNRDASKQAKQELIARGCKNYTLVTLDRWDGGGTYAYVSFDNLCRGHIDADAYVFVANIYDPTSDAVTNKSETSEDENTSENKSSNGDGKAFDYIEEKDKEYKYSLYALDKYATVFDSADTTGKTKDQESVDIANGKENRAAEQFVMEDITGLPMKIVDWWKNDTWFTNLSTTKTYFRLPNFEESFDLLPAPKAGENVVNKENSMPYWFNAFTSESGRNTKFEAHGWDNDSIMMVRLLMGSDWTELYGIKDFGYIQGSPMTPAQISQLISNNKSWDELSDDRKNIMAQAILFQQKAQAYDLRYVLGGSHSARISDIKRGDTFDCSGYISSIMYNAGLFSPAQTSTAGLYSSSYFRKLKPGETMLAGDIMIKYSGSSGTNGNGNHVVLYMGGDNISEAKGKKYPLSTTFNYSNAKGLLASGQYEILRLTTIDDSKHTIKMSDLTGSD